VIVLESKPDPCGGPGGYTLAIFEGIDPDALVKSGTYFAGQPVALTDGREVGRVLSNARSPVAFRVAGRSFPIETPVIEIAWHSANFQKVAEKADLRLEGGRILLVGDEPISKAARPGWGRALALGEISGVHFR
jgi:hypothetical protein